MNEKIEALIAELKEECRAQDLNLIISVAGKGYKGKVHSAIVGKGSVVAFLHANLGMKLSEELGENVEKAALRGAFKGLISQLLEDEVD